METSHYYKLITLHFVFVCITRTTASQDVQTWFSVQLAYTKFLYKIMGYLWGSVVLKNSFNLDRNIAKANCTENQSCTSRDAVVLLHDVYLCTLISIPNKQFSHAVNTCHFSRRHVVISNLFWIQTDLQMKRILHGHTQVRISQQSPFRPCVKSRYNSRQICHLRRLLISVCLVTRWQQSWS